jgi:hypothetical protein
MSMEAVMAALGGFGILWLLLGLFVFVAPLAIWIHTARTAAAVRKHTQLLGRIADAQERLAMAMPCDPPRTYPSDSDGSHLSGVAPVSPGNLWQAAMSRTGQKECPKCRAPNNADAISCPCGHQWT